MSKKNIGIAFMSILFGVVLISGILYSHPFFNLQDGDGPVVNIISPVYTAYESEPILLNIEASDSSGVDSIWYNWNGMNITYSSEQYIIFNEGLNTLEAWANDSVGNEHSASILFTILNNINFSSVWDTSITNEMSSNANQVKLPLDPSGIHQFIVNWGDGCTNLITNYNQPEATHTYNTPGIYTINISGTLIGFTFRSFTGILQVDRVKILNITNWGDVRLGNSGYYFYKCSSLKISAQDILNLTGTTSFAHAFEKCLVLDTIPHIGEWDMSHITDFEGAFWDAPNFNDDIGDWDMSNATNLSFMFFEATSFNQDIGGWDVSNVITMKAMFVRAYLFNQNLTRWDVSHVTDMSRMFGEASAFNGNISNWDVSRVVDMSGMFDGAVRFNQNISNWDVSNVVNMNAMFAGAAMNPSTFNQDISGWDVSHVTDMSDMFAWYSAFDQDLGSWNVSSVTDMSGMFTASTLSTTNYDSLLIGWSALNLRTGVTFDVGYSKYSLGDADAARQSIINTFGWTINDQGHV